MNIYDFKVRDAEGKEVSLAKYKGTTLLIINSSTSCFFTPQYKGLEALYEEMKDRDFMILDFPCNQFGDQGSEPLSENGMACQMMYDIQFDRFSMVDVNGDNADPLFKYLKENAKFGGLGINIDAIRVCVACNRSTRILEDKTKDIHWNFTKFLVDKNGEVVARFEPTEPVEIIRGEVNRLLNGEELSVKKRFKRKSKETTSSAGKRLLGQRIKTAIFFFMLTYLITFIFDFIIPF